MVHVLSTEIRAVGYDESCNVLRITFQAGHSYDYLNVPQRVYGWLLHAPSKGEFYNAHIRDMYRFAHC